MFASRTVPSLPRPLVALMVIAGAIACGEIITGPDDDEATRPRSMRIAPAQLSLAQAETSRVTATLHAASGAETESEPGRTLFYRSSDAGIASVDSLTGLVTALTDGTVSVQAVYGALTLGIPVQVLARPRLEVVSGQGQVGEQGDTLAARLVVRALDAAGSPIADTAVTFTAVTGGGALQAVSERTDASGIAQARWELGLELGAQSVEVTSPGLDAVAFTATVTAGTSVASIEIAPVSESLVGVGATRQLTAVAFNKAHVALPGAVFAWTSAGEGIATVDASGLVTAVAGGSTHIRATSGAVTDSVIVVVEIPVVLAKIALGDDIRHPAGLQAARTFTLPAAAAIPTIVTLRSTRPENTLLALDAETRGEASIEVSVPAGATMATYWMHGVEGTAGGNADLVAEAPGLEPDTIEVINEQPAARLTLVGPSTVPASGGADPVLLMTVGQVVDGTLVPMALRAFGAPANFDVVAQDQARAMVMFRATAATNGGDSGPSVCVAFELRPGFSATMLPNAEFGIPASLSVVRSGIAGTAAFSLASLDHYLIFGEPVTITLTPDGTPIIGVAPTSVSFTTPSSGGDPDEQTLAITNAGSGTLSGLSVNVAYVEGASDWLTATLDATTAPTVIRLQPSVAGLAPGTYGAIVEIISAVTSEVTEVEVELTVTGDAPLPKLFLGPDLRHPAQVQAMYTVTVPTIVNDPVAVTITTSDADGVRVGERQVDVGSETAEVEVEGGTDYGEYWLKGQVRGSERVVRIIASAPGYEPDTMMVTVVRPVYVLRNIPPGTRPATGGEDPVLVLAVGAHIEDGVFTPMALSPGIEPPSFTLQAEDPLVGLVQFFPSERVMGAAQGPASTVTFAMLPGFNQTSDGNFLFEVANIRLARTGAGGSALVSVQFAPGEFDAMFATAGYTFTTPDVVVRRVAITPQVSSLTAIGQTVQLTAAAYNAADSLITSAVIAWESPAPGTATVSSSGLVTAVGPGTVMITATSGTGSDRAEVIVNIAPVCSFGSLTITGSAPTVGGAFCPGSALVPTEPNAQGDVTSRWVETFDYGNGAYFESFSLSYNPTTGVISAVTHHLNDPQRTITLSCSPLPFAPPPCTSSSVNLLTGVVTFTSQMLGQGNPITVTGTLDIAPPPPLARLTFSAAAINQPAGLQSPRTGTFVEPVPAASTLTLRSLQPAALLVGPDSLTTGEMQVAIPIAQGATTFAYYVHGVEGTIGQASRLVAEMPGFRPETVTVNSVTPAFKLCCAQGLVLPALGAPDHDLRLVTGHALDAGLIDTMAVRIGGAEPTFQLGFSASGIVQALFRASAATSGTDQGPANAVTFQLRAGRSSTQAADAGLGLPSSLGIRAAAAGSVQLVPSSTSAYLNVDADPTVTVTPTEPPAFALSLVGTPVLGVNGSAVLRVTLPFAAPAGGLLVTLTSGNVDRATVNAPASVLVAAGATVADFTVVGVSAGNVSFTAAAAGLDDATLSVTVSTNSISVPVLHNVPFTRTATLPVSLPQPAPAGGITITITSSDPAVVGVQTAAVFIAAGALTASAMLEGVTLGEASVTAAAQGFATGTSTVRVTAVLDIIETNLAMNAGFSVANLTTRLLSAGTVFPAPAGGVALTFVSRNPACVAAPAPLSIAAGLNSVATSAAYGGTAVTPCATRLVVTSPSFDPDSVTITVNPPPTSSLSVTSRLAAGLSREGTLFLGTASPAGGTAVTLTSSDPSRLLVAPNAATVGAASIQLSVPAGQSSVGFTYAAVEGATGAPALSVTVDRYTPPPPQTIDIDPLGVDYSGSINLTVLAGDGGGTVSLGSLTAGPSQSVINEAVIRAGGQPVTITLTSTTPGVAVPVVAGVAASPRTVIILPGQSRASLSVRALAAGTTTIVATSSGATSPVRAGYPAVITVTQPGSSLSITPRLAAGLSRAGTMFLAAGAPAGGTVVTLASSDPTRIVLSTGPALVGAESVEITFPAGSSSAGFTYAVLEDVTGSATISATIHGAPPAFSAPVPMEVSIDPLGVEYSGSTALTLLAGGGNGTVSLGSLTAAGPSQSVINETIIRAGGRPVAVTITSTTPSVVLPSVDGVAASPQSVTILPGASRVSFQLRQQSAGTSTIVVSSDGALSPVRANYPATITVTQPVSSINISQRIAAGLARAGTVFLGAAAPPGGTVMRLSSSDATRLILSSNLQTVGGTSVDVTFAAGTSSATFAYAGVEGTTGTVTLSGTILGTPPDFSDPASIVVTVDPLGVDATGTTALTTLGTDGNGTVSLGSLVASSGQESVINEAVVRTGGLTYTITLTSSTPAVAVPVVAGVAASPRTLTIGPGQSRAAYTIRPLTAGTTTITATTAGAATPVRVGYPATITVSSPSTFLSVGARLGAGLQAGATAFLGVAAPAGGLTMTLTSSDPSRLLLAPNATTAGAAQITMPFAQGSTSASFVVMGLEDVSGNPTITAQTPGFTDAAAPVSVEPIGVQWSGVTSLTTLATDGNGTVVVGIITGLAGNRVVQPEQNIRFGGVARSITLSSSTPAVALPVVGGVAMQDIIATIAPGQSRAAVNVRPLSSGTTVLSATGPGLIPAETPTVPQQVTVTTPTQSLSVGNLSQGAGLSQNATLFLQTAVPAGGRTLTVTSVDPSRLLLAPNATSAGVAQLTISLTAGQTSAPFTVMGLEGATGASGVTTSLAGYRDTTFAFVVVQPAVALDGPAATRSMSQGDLAFLARVGIPQGVDVLLQPVRFGAPGPLEVTLVSSAPAFGTLVVNGVAGSPATVLIPVGQSQSSSLIAERANFRPVAAGGNTTITATIPGYLQQGQAIRTVTVTP